MMQASGLLISALAVVGYMIPANGTLKWSFSSLMAQTFATSPLVIYNTLAANTSFVNTLGDYTFTGGVTSKSFAVLRQVRIT